MANQSTRILQHQIDAMGKDNGGCRQFRDLTEIIMTKMMFHSQRSRQEETSLVAPFMMLTTAKKTSTVTKMLVSTATGKHHKLTSSDKVTHMVM